MSDPKQWDLTKAVVPLASVISVIIGLGSGYLYLESKFDGAASERQTIRDKIVENSNKDQRKFDSIEFRLKDNDRKTERKTMELWIERLARQNAALDVPDLPEE